MATLNETLSQFVDSENTSEHYLSPKHEERENGSPSPTDDPQIGDIGAMAIQQLAAASQPQGASEEMEREMSFLERDIKRQKESSVNAKTAITFEQLKRIHQIGKILGPAKEGFYDRICRAADIQRASLKNRLKQNKEKFEPPLGGFSASSTPSTPSFSFRNGGSISMDSPNHSDGPTIFNIPNGAMNTLNPFLFPPPEMNQMEFKPSPFMRAPASMDARSITPLSMGDEENVRIPVERVNELFQLGFTYEEVKEFNCLFDQFKTLSKDVCPPSQLLTAFSNFISQSVPEPLKLICTTFNLLEMGYTRREMLKIVNKERRNREENEDSDVKPMKKPCVDGDINAQNSD